MKFTEAERKRIKKNHKRRLRRINKEDKKQVSDTLSSSSSSTIGQQQQSLSTETNVNTVSQANSGTATYSSSDESSLPSPSEHTPINLAMPQFAYVYRDDYIKYYDGIGYPAFAVNILNMGPRLLQMETETEVQDPAFQICDVQVKIGDLGNACWVVIPTLLNLIRKMLINFFC